MSKAIQGAAMLAGAVALGAADFFSGGLLTPFVAQAMEALIVGGIAMEAGAIADALTQNRGMSITTRQPAAFRQVIYGERRIGGIKVYESTTGSHYDQYNLIIVIATHEIDSIVNLYLDGRRVHWNGSNSGGNTTRNGVNFGGPASGGDFIGPGGQHYNFDGLVYCEARFGDQAPGDVILGMTANDPTWATGANGSPYMGGCAYVYLKVEYDQSMFPSFPEIKFTVRGKSDIFDPRKTAPPAADPVTLQRPTTLLNGWGANAHEGAYEEGTDQGYGWGTDSGTTQAYSNPDNAVDGSDLTSASCKIQHTHAYAGCVWSFAALGQQPSSLYLNVLSEVMPINGAARSAGLWYSLDGGSTWTKIYNAGYRQKQWDSIELSATQDASQIQVMAFLDAHDDMDHYVYDIHLDVGPQTSQVQSGYTNNWALIVADILTDPQWGLGDTGSVNQAQLVAAANVCDEQVDLAAGSTESRYCASLVFDTGTSPGDILQKLMPAAAGRLSRIGGEWYPWPAYWQGPSFTFDESVLTGPIQWTPYRKFRDLFNRVRGTYIAPNFPYNVSGDLYDTNGWFDGSIQNNFPFAFQPTNYPEYAVDQLHGYSDDKYLGEDGGIFLPKEISQDCVISVTQAQRCAKIMLMRNRQQGSGMLPMRLDAWRAQVIDVMQQTLSLYGWFNKQLEITSTRFAIEKKGEAEQVVGIQCGVQETDQSTYEWSTTEELTVYDVPANPAFGVPYAVAAPTALTLQSDASTALTAADGTVTPRILASWTAPTDSTVSQVEVQYQKAGDSSWITAGLVSAQTTAFYIGGVVSGQSYNVQVASIRSNGAMSAWVSGSVTVSAPSSAQSSYSNSPAIALSQPSATAIDMAAVAVTFGSAVVNYAARTFTIPTPSAETWYYVTIADATQAGEAGTPTLTATCQTSNALVGVQGNTYIGAILALPGGGATQILAGGWPAPQTFQVGA